MKKYTVEMKINKDFCNEPDYNYNVWDSDVYPEGEADTADEAIGLAMDDYRDSMADDTMENIECEEDTIYYTENGIPCRILFKAIERQV